MLISGFDKLSLTNFPGVVACTIFTNTCNWRCFYCQNSTLAYGTEEEHFTEQEVLDYLEKRHGLVDGICISGGEPTMHEDLPDFIRKIKKIPGIQVKLDTNGSHPKMVKELLDENLLDYVAMDIKMPLQKYETITEVPVNQKNLRETIELLKNSGIRHEFRTTIIKEYHSLEDILGIVELVGTSDYYLQNFVDSENVPRRGLHGFTEDELREIERKVKEKYPKAKVRGI